MPELCPCSRGLPYDSCCQPYHADTMTAADPVTLMRSRYAAYVKCDVDYLIATWHPSHQAEKWRASVTESCQETRWLGLNILATFPGKTPDESYVEFAARYTSAANPQQAGLMRERSRFLRYHDRWYYMDGIHLQTGRNEHCPCGSGKKYKKCCGQ
ncbi:MULTISPECIES: YchJ family protein [unclassified Brenneria]|uniref:YchJ family protein n=1 Tax=unclassified Brenneria TaxID=2634434 RepID=UPI0018F0B9A2|nr:YchJ family protein [Brenneria sp. L3-3C-1]MEE3641974.1 YchJ family protein [Brenneria sp. L3_3C_1]